VTTGHLLLPPKFSGPTRSPYPDVTIPKHECLQEPETVTYEATAPACDSPALTPAPIICRSQRLEMGEQVDVETISACLQYSVVISQLQVEPYHLIQYGIVIERYSIQREFLIRRLIALYNPSQFTLTYDEGHRMTE
jgi:hypothetical protein